MSLPYAAGSLYSTVEDLYLWDQALYTDKLLSPQLKELMYKPGMNNYAYGWDVRKPPLGAQDEPVTDNWARRRYKRVQHGHHAYAR